MAAPARPLPVSVRTGPGSMETLWDSAVDVEASHWSVVNPGFDRPVPEPVANPLDNGGVGFAAHKRLDHPGKQSIMHDTILQNGTVQSMVGSGME